jgi:type I restriction enzyme M protein
MKRVEIINTIGSEFLQSNIENDEFSYPKELKKIGKTINKNLIKSKNTTHEKLDIRFVKDNISILVETKNNFDQWKEEETYTQLQAYVNYENVLTGNKIIAILANTQDDRIKVWWGSDIKIDESHQIKNQYNLKSFDEYAEIYTSKQNNREQVLRNTYSLNETLHNYGISEKIRSQFVGTCLLALKNNLIYERLSTKQIIGGIEGVITGLLDSDLDKAFKLGILKNNILESQDVRTLKKEETQEILREIENNILPFINDKSTLGQDILNLFFTTFNKYVGKADKNQAFTPDHIVHFMCQVVGVNRNSKVLDPCCGSGAFLVRAMTEAMDDCDGKSERNRIKKKNIFGIEYEDTAFGLSTTNMLIHGDGNSNVRQGSLFNMRNFISDSHINVVLMNPPYNAQRKYCDPEYVKSWKKETKQDPSKGFHYVDFIASVVKTGKLAVLLPMQCAIGGTKDIQKYKEKILENHTLDAVFSLPSDVFHPGASASACCMIFNLGIRHKNSNQDTFFGYFKDDGFVKKRNLGRVEKTKKDSTEGIWADIESQWLSKYRERKSVPGLSVARKVGAKDEWLAEAYMETDYSQIKDENFSQVIRDFISFKVSSDEI